MPAAAVLIAEYVNGSYTTYGTGGFCNVAGQGDSTSNFMSGLGGGSGGASNCATGAEGVGSYSPKASCSLSARATPSRASSPAHR